MGRPKSNRNVVPIDTSNVTPGSIAGDIFPEGTPTEDDGTVMAEASISIPRARKIGAITPAAAAKNRRVAKVTAKKQNGEKNVEWGEDNAIDLFDMVVQTYPSSGLYAYISQIHPENIEYTPVRLNAFQHSAALYDHILKYIHKAHGQATYEVKYKDAISKQYRATGRVTLPDTTNDLSLRDQSFAPPGYPQPPSPYGYPPGYPQPSFAYGNNGGGGGAGAGYVPVHSVQTPQPPQQVQPQPIQAPPVHQQAPPQISDPAITAVLTQIMSELKTLQQGHQVSQMQAAAALGALEEFKRSGYQQPQTMQAPPPTPAPQQQPQTFQPPPPPQWREDQLFDRFGRPVPMPYQNQRGVGQVQPQQQPPPPPPPAPAQQQPDMVHQITGMMHTIESLKKAVMGGSLDEVADEVETPDALAIVKPPPFVSTKLGTNDNSPVMVTREDGQIDWTATMMGNLPLLPDFLNRAASGISSIQQQVSRAQHTRPIMAQGVSYPQQQPQRAFPQPVQQPVQPQAPPPPPPSFIPDLNTLG
jgi:hypothetical protein